MFQAMMEGEPSRHYLRSLLNKSLQLHIADGRMFVGLFKATDNERNIILSQAFEYRTPSASMVASAAAEHTRQGKTGNVKVDMDSRFMGLIVVPGQYITKIELE